MAKRLTTKTVTLPAPAKGRGPLDPITLVFAAKRNHPRTSKDDGASRAKLKHMGFGAQGPDGCGQSELLPV